MQEDEIRTKYWGTPNFEKERHAISSGNNENIVAISPFNIQSDNLIEWQTGADDFMQLSNLPNIRFGFVVKTNLIDIEKIKLRNQMLKDLGILQ